MYIPPAFKVPDEAAAFELIGRYDFGTIVTSTPESGMVATHLPLLLKPGVSGPILQGHVARANTHWQFFDGSTEAIVIFQGPHGYIPDFRFGCGTFTHPISRHALIVRVPHKKPRQNG
jgi:transcriptional regulator